MSDCIEREAAILGLLEKGQHSRRYKLGDVWELNFDEIREAIAGIPAADVRPVVRGKWVQVMGKYDWMVKCSRCNGVPLEIINFCPYCGADNRPHEEEKRWRS